MEEILKEHPLEYSNREELVYYMCQIHNILNKKFKNNMKIFNIFSKKKETLQVQYSFTDWRDYIELILKSSYQSIPFDDIRERFPLDYSKEYNRKT